LRACGGWLDFDLSHRSDHQYYVRCAGAVQGTREDMRKGLPD
jgi:hypothetical protein